MKHIKMFRAALAALVTVLAALQAQAADIFVSPTGSGGKTGANWSNALNGSNDGWHIDVAAAITAAIGGGAEKVNVYFAAGEYTIANQLALSSIAIPVKFSGGYVGAADDSFAKSENATTLKRSAGNIRFLSGSSLSNLTIDGMTFTGGYISSKGAKGGAIYLGSSSTVISNCIFNANRVHDPNSAGSGTSSFGGGGAIAVVGGSADISDCTFSRNYRSAGPYNATWGGAIYSNNADLSVTDCLFDSNYLDCASSRPYLFGAAIGTYKGNISISDCMFSGNYIYGCNVYGGGWGGAMAIRNASSFKMSDCTVKNCYVGNGTTTHWQGGLMLLDDLDATDGVMTSVVERCVFDMSGVPDSIGGWATRSDIILFGGHLCMTNCIVARTRGTNTGMEGAVRVCTGTVRKKDYEGYFYETSGSWTAAKSSAELVNCTFADGNKSGVVREISNSYETELTVKNCIVSGNKKVGVLNATSIEYNYIQTNDDGSWNYEGEGNLNPNVVGDINWTGAPYYHLLTKKANGAITNGWFSGTFESAKTAADSPCIDAGAPGSAVLDLEPYYSGRRVNIGAYGGTPWASKTSSIPGFKLIIR